MKTHTLVQASANIIRVTSLKKGNIFKLIDSPSYGDAELAYCVVLDIFNDGDKTFIQVLRYKVSYSTVTAEIKLIKGDTDVSLFPASKEEVMKYFSNAMESMEYGILKKTEELEKAKEAFEHAKKFVKGEMENELTEIEYKEEPTPNLIETTQFSR